MIKRNILLSVATVLITAAGVAAAQGNLPGQSNNQIAPTGTQQQVEAGQAVPDGQTPAPTANEPQAAATAPQGSATTPALSQGAEATPGVQPPATVLSAPAEQVEPTPAPVVRTGQHHIRFVDVSPADKPNSKASQYCDFAMTDGSTDSVWAGSVTYNFTQPISNYNENNLPGLYSAC